MIYRKLVRVIPRLKREFYLRWNRFNLRHLGAQIGSNVNVFNKLYVLLMPNSTLTIGDDCIILSGDGINPLGRNIRTEIFAAKNAKIRIGNHVGISCSSLWAKTAITIGDYTNIGANSVIIDTDAHSLDWRIRAGMTDLVDTEAATSAPINIGQHVLIGTGCRILKGVTIGDRCIIGAGSVVTKSIPADCIAGGNPARVIKQLN